MKHRTLGAACFLLVATNLDLQNCFAGEAGHAAGHGELPPFGEFILHLSYNWINFLVYVSILYFLLRRPLGGAMGSRRMRIADQVRESASALTASERALEEVQRKNASLTQEIAALKQSIETEGVMEAKRIEDEARDRAARISRMSSEAIKAEWRAASKFIQKRLVDNAISLAERQFKEHGASEADKVLRRQALDAVTEVIQ